MSDLKDHLYLKGNLPFARVLEEQVATMASHDNDLKEKIRIDFVHHVIPSYLMRAIWKYDKNVLSPRDVEHIKITKRNRGNMAGAKELLDYMARYDNWFPCLLQALRDPDVKLDSLAMRFSSCKTELDRTSESPDWPDVSDFEYDDSSVESDFPTVPLPSSVRLAKLGATYVAPDRRKTSTATCNRKLKEKIRMDFNHHVMPNHLLTLIWKYNANILTERDTQYIRAVTHNRGNIAGAEVLLDYMARYDNWFPCLLQALSDPDMKMERLAMRFSKYKAELDGSPIALHERPNLLWLQKLQLQESTMASYNKQLKDKIWVDFKNYVIPHNLLPVIPKYDKNVLTPEDEQHIRAETNNRGDMAGAEVLLDKMAEYDNWFPCLLQALRDPGVKMEHVTLLFLNCKAELDATLIGPHQPQGWYQNSVTHKKHSKNKTR
ncbi:hypothetical protein PoB_006651700 [Plakobranchus ocellatus]|uniref:Caspase recruitment domain-containing protein n=1 Tax=Plakobranchus ocellatus TaxID=259542 RepID=A0AAV4D7E2_9GAST|nr:hypothetical protein PoB_006651700 [Plakobranchus ocellatus]